MSSFDVLDILLNQHHEMRHLSAVVRQAHGADKKRLFDRLSRLVNVHEFSDRRVVHPATRGSTPEGDRVGLACMVEEGNIGRAVAGLQVLVVGGAAFDDKFAELCRAIADHTAHEERDEFPILRRYVGPARLHVMASEVRDVQTMAAT